MRRSLKTSLLVLLFAAVAPAASAESLSVTAAGTTTFTVPAGVTALSFAATGGAGGDLKNSTGTILVPGGRGAVVSGTVAVTPGQQLQLTVAANAAAETARRV